MTMQSIIKSLKKIEQAYRSSPLPLKILDLIMNQTKPKSDWFCINLLQLDFSLWQFHVH
jgi:hypothetical protein